MNYTNIIQKLIVYRVVIGCLKWLKSKHDQGWVQALTLMLEAQAQEL